MSERIGDRVLRVAGLLFTQGLKPQSFASSSARLKSCPDTNHPLKCALKGVALLAVVGVLLLAGCRQDMHDQPKVRPLRSSDFYADQQSARPMPVGTVARGQLHDDEYFYSGRAEGKEGEEMPFPVTEEVLERGRERFNIYCAPCHSRLGDGEGIVVQRGFKHPPSYFETRLMQAPIGHFFVVMSHGYGSMADYSSQVPVADRWKIAAYIRALQLSHSATAADVPAGSAMASAPQTERKEK